MHHAHATDSPGYAAPPRAMFPNTSRVLETVDRRTRELAAAMNRLNAEHQLSGGCTDVLLRLEGFSDHELRQLGPTATRLAKIGFLRQDAPAGDEPVPDELLIAESVKLFEQLPAAFVARLRARLDDDTLARLWPKIATGAASRLARSPLPARLGAEAAGVSRSVGGRL